MGEWSKIAPTNRGSEGNKDCIAIRQTGIGIAGNVIESRLDGKNRALFFVDPQGKRLGIKPAEGPGTFALQKPGRSGSFYCQAMCVIRALREVASVGVYPAVWDEKEGMVVADLSRPAKK